MPSLVRFSLVLLAADLAATGMLQAQINAYNPYADSQAHLPPVAPDGTLRWGTFYKSAAIQQAYERLWNLGACRNTNKAITVPVEMNKVAIDSLPEETFRGVVQAASGTLHGGMFVFTVAGDEGTTLVATLHPAGVSKLAVSGRISASELRPGMTVRLQTCVDRRGTAAEPVRTIDVITPAAGFQADAVVEDQPTTVVGTVTRIQGTTLRLQVAAGRIRRLAIPIGPDTVVNVDAAQLDLVAPGDVVLVEGRVWRGEGCLGDGTVFASAATVTKADAVPAARQARESVPEIGVAGPTGRGGF